MFTGLVHDVGEVATVATPRLTIKTNRLDAEKFNLGASVACNGVCLTVVEKTARQFVVDVSAETLAKTTMRMWQVGAPVNLEPSLRLGDELGGHLVYGHVDGLAECMAVKQEGDCWRLSFAVPDDLAPFIAPKSAVALDGVSLTVNEVMGHSFGVMIIPHTWKNTGFSAIKKGQKLNLEVDMLARYVARLREFKK